MAPLGARLLPVTECIFILTAASGFSLTKVLHTLAYSFFAPTIYVWIICHKRVCADEILSLCVFNFFWAREGKAVCISLPTAGFFRITLTGSVCTRCGEWFEVIVLYLCLPTSLWLNKMENRNVPLCYFFSVLSGSSFWLLVLLFSTVNFVQVLLLFAYQSVTGLLIMNCKLRFHRVEGVSI